MHKVIVKTFYFLEVISVIRGRKRSLEGHTLDSLLLLYSWGSQLLIDMHKGIVETFSFLEVIQVIIGHYKVKHWIRCCYCIPGVPSFCLIYTKPQLKPFHFWKSFRSLEVIDGQTLDLLLLLYSLGSYLSFNMHKVIVKTF